MSSFYKKFYLTIISSETLDRGNISLRAEATPWKVKPMTAKINYIDLIELLIFTAFTCWYLSKSGKSITSLAWNYCKYRQMKVWHSYHIFYSKRHYHCIFECQFYLRCFHNCVCMYKNRFVCVFRLHNTHEIRAVFITLNFKAYHVHILWVKMSTLQMFHTGFNSN